MVSVFLFFLFYSRKPNAVQAPTGRRNQRTLKEKSQTETEEAKRFTEYRMMASVHHDDSEKIFIFIENAFWSIQNP